MDINESQGSLETISLTDLIEISNFSDLIFLSGASMVFRVATALLADHKDMLLQCRNFEQLMDYFKTTLPCMGASQLERVIHEVMTRPVVVSAFKSIATPHTCFRLGRSCFFSLPFVILSQPFESGVFSSGPDTGYLTSIDCL